MLAIAVSGCAGCAVTPERAEPGGLAVALEAATGICAAGEQRLDVGSPRAAVLYVPQMAALRSAQGTGSPLLVFFHGATQSPERMIEHLRPLADEHGVVVLAPASRDVTWDAIRGQRGVDAPAIERALAMVLGSCHVDSRRFAIGGFSDGASYALMVGLPSGDVFTHILAFSACIIHGTETRQPKPKVFLSHGRADGILPFASCGRRIDAQLRQAGYHVRFEVFDGDHEVPPPVAEAAFRWFLGLKAPPASATSR